jgi:predicted cation transporter
MLGVVYVARLVSAVTLFGVVVALFAPRRRAVEAAVFGMIAAGAGAAVTAAARDILWSLAESRPRCPHIA